MSKTVYFKVAGKEADPDNYRFCRQMLVGPWHNQPEEYEGYNGFVGWSASCRLKSGKMLVTFSSGFWHASFPWTEEVRAEMLSNSDFRKAYEHCRRLGCPDIRAPRGGRAHIMYSYDDGKSWSKPETLVDTELDDRHPTIIELDDGTWLCTFFTYAMGLLKDKSYGRIAYPMYMFSTDGGKVWSEPVALPGNAGGFGNGCAIKLSDGSVICTAYEKLPGRKYSSTSISRSSDNGKTFQAFSAIHSASNDLDESSIAELPNGTLVSIARRKGDVSFSNDRGRNWTEPTSCGVELYDPHLLVMPNGILACFHGSYKKGFGGIRVILSQDGGKTWHGPGGNYGYSIDPSVYGYSHPILLPDGTVYLTYLHTGGHYSADARTEAIWALRIKINDNADGIEILPAPGSPAAKSSELSELCAITMTGGDPELGNL